MPRDDTPAPFAGYSGPRYTPVPDQLFDEQLPDLSGAELKVLLYIIRRTFGWKRASDNIALSQMLHGIATRDGRILDRGVGLSKKTLLAAINSLEARRIIFTERRRSAERGNEPTTYRLNVREDAPCAPLGGETPPPLGQSLPQGVGHAAPPSPWREHSPTQQPVLQETAPSNIRRGNPQEASADPLVGASPLPAASRGQAQPEAAGAILRRHHGPPDPDEREAREAVAGYLRDIASEFGDRAPLHSSTARALNLLHAADLPLAAFLGRLVEARAITRDRATGPGTTPRNRMGYFFAVLANLLGLPSGQGTGAAPGDGQPAKA